MRAFPWNETSEARLSELVGQKLSSRQIATILSNEFFPATRNTVIGKCHRMKLVLHHGQAGPKQGTPSPLRGRKVESRKAPSKPMGWVKIARPKYVEPGDTGERQPPTPDAFAIPVSNRVKLMDLRETHCRFPSGDPSEEDFGFCGEFADYGVPYCRAHLSIAYRPSDQSRAQDRRLIKWAVRA